MCVTVMAVQALSLSGLDDERGVEQQRLIGERRLQREQLNVHCLADTLIQNNTYIYIVMSVS